MNYVNLALLVLILCGVLYFGLKKGPKQPDKAPEGPSPPTDTLPTQPPISLLGVAIQPPELPAEFDPTRFPPFYYPLGIGLCFKAQVTDSNPNDGLAVTRYAWEVRRVDKPYGGVVTAQVTDEPSWCWSGEGVGAACGQTEPIPMLVRCVAELTNGDLLEARRAFWLVPQSGWR